MRFCLFKVFAFLFVIGHCPQGFSEVVVNWAKNATLNGGNARFAPDGQLASLTDAAPTFEVSNFTDQRSYGNLEALLNVPFSTLQQAEVIAWEGNGGSAAQGGGWEGTNFVFSDGIRGLILQHGEFGLSPGVLGTGTIDGAQYESFFGIASGTAQPKMSWILLDNVFDLVNIRSSALTIELTAGHSLGFPGEGTADPDAIGLLVTAVPEPSSLTLSGLLIALAGFAKMLYRRKRRKIELV